MTPLQDCLICSSATSRLYTAPEDGLEVCYRCLPIPKAFRLARFEGVPADSISAVVKAAYDSNQTGVFRIPATIITPALRRFMDRFLGAIRGRPGDCHDN